MATILVVDDDADICTLLKTQLEHEGYLVLTASSVVEARPLMSRKPSVILLDIDMPGETGVDLLFELRKNPEHKDVPVIFVTAYGERAVPLQSTGRGAARVITKPFKREDILKALKEVRADHKPS